MDRYVDLALSFIKEFQGERVAGTEGEERARSVFKKYFGKIGVKYREESFELFISKGIKGYVEVDGKKFDIRPYGLSVPYDIEGKLFYFDHPEEALSPRIDIDGRVCLFATNPSYDHTVKLKKRGCRGFITPSPPGRSLLSLHLRQKAIKENNIIPSATILYEDAVYLLEYTGKTIKMHGEGSTFKTTAYNLIVELNGRYKTEERIVITGHYDTVPFSPGFSDNGAGVATMMSLLSYFKDHGTGRTLEFVFFSGEEWGLCGSLSYVQHRKNTLDNLVCGINLDVGGVPVGRLMGRITGNESILKVVEGVLRENGIYVDLKKGIYSSDSIPFAEQGVPFINLARVGGKATLHIHTENDKGYYVRQEGFRRYFEAARILIERISNAELLPFTRGIDEDVKKELNRYLKERM